MNNPFEYRPSKECREAFQMLLRRIMALKKSSNPDDMAFCRELEAGKMLGVLIASDAEGQCHTLYAFSGQLGQGGFHREGFVEPVFDYLDPAGYFKTHEAQISALNREIQHYEAGSLAEAKRRYEEEKQRLDAEIAEYKAQCRKSKAERQAIRERGDADESLLARLMRQSQFEKAELHRRKKQARAQMAPYEEALREAEAHLSSLKARRKADSEALQQWLFSNTLLLNAKGETCSVSAIFASTPLGIAPSGAGECCAPKLLQGAYRRGWHPEAIAEFWYGRPKSGEVRRHGQSYPACRGKCLPVLSWMLQGLDVEPPLGSELGRTAPTEPRILFENRWFCVVDKPSGMLSVPGKGGEMSVEQWLARRYGEGTEVRMAHRLDQDTSGLIIAALGHEAYRVLQCLFASREVEKTYIADLHGDYHLAGHPEIGRIELPLAPDWLDRPRQRVDYEVGKMAVTEYKFIYAEDGRSRIMFHPLTGRTHQLRVHAASESGLGMPIIGDRLYGSHEGEPLKGTSEGDSTEGVYGASLPQERLHLHAHRIAFRFPLDGNDYAFESPVPF